MELPQPEKQNEDSTFNNISNGERLNIFPKIVNKPSMSIKLFLSKFIQYCPGGSSQYKE